MSVPVLFCHCELSQESVVAIVNVLQGYCGEHGHNEGALETLQRLEREIIDARRAAGYLHTAMNLWPDSAARENIDNALHALEPHG